MTGDLPEGWRIARLGELGEWGSGGTPSKARADFWELGRIPWLSPKDLKRPRIGDSIDHVTQAAVTATRLRLLPPGSVVFVVRGLILARSFPVALTEASVTINQDLRYLVPTRDVVPSYLAWVLRHSEPRILEAVREATHGTLRLESDTLRDLLIPLPPLSDQQRIVEKVEALLVQVNTARERLTRASEILKRFRRSVLAAACAGRLTKEWRGGLGGPTTAGLDDEADMDGLPELPDIPSTWATVPLGAISRDVQYGASVKASNDPSGVPILRMGNIQDGNLDPSDLKYVGHAEAINLRGFLTEPGDVLFNRTNSPELVGKTAVVAESRPMLFASYLIRVRPRQDVALPEYVSFWLNSPWAKSWARVVRTDGVSQSNINAAKLKRMPVPLPPLAEQQAIIRRVRQLLTGSAALDAPLTAAQTRAANLERAILEKALSGELVETSPAQL